MTNWALIDTGAKVVAKYRGKLTDGVLVAVCGGREKGKLRINLDGDKAQYREIAKKDVTIAPTESAKADEPMPKVARPAHPLPAGPDWKKKYDRAVKKMRDFHAASDGHITKEELGRAISDL
jgi:hypothetical protein